MSGESAVVRREINGRIYILEIRDGQVVSMDEFTRPESVRSLSPQTSALPSPARNACVHSPAMRSWVRSVRSRGVRAWFRSLYTRCA
jgi:hypothetical protein